MPDWPQPQPGRHLSRGDNAIEQAFAEYNRQHSEEPIGARIGLHAGQPARDEDTFCATDVNLTARIADDVAQAGEMVVSSPLEEPLEGYEDYALESTRSTA